MRLGNERGKGDGHPKAPTRRKTEQRRFWRTRQQVRARVRLHYPPRFVGEMGECHISRSSAPRYVFFFFFFFVFCFLFDALEDILFDFGVAHFLTNRKKKKKRKHATRKIEARVGIGSDTKHGGGGKGGWKNNIYRRRGGVGHIQKMLWTSTSKMTLQPSITSSAQCSSDLRKRTP
jgi:hypothetical protein